jgi:hypothetical protein
MKARHLASIALVGAAGSLVAGAACAAADPALIQARQKLFGLENVDANTGGVKKDKVLFSWITNASFATSVAGRVLLLDTYVTRLEVTPGRTPVVVKDLVDLKPDAILLGHGHGDHADNAAYIAAKTGAPVYASPETCAALQVDLARLKNDPNVQGNATTAIAASAQVQCLPVTSNGSTPASEVVRVPVLEPVACVVAFRHLHSVAVPPDPTFAPTPVQIIVDPRDATLFPAGTPLTPAANTPPQLGQMNLTTSQGAGAVISIYYQFVMRGGYNFTFGWHNTAGALKEGCGADTCWGPTVGQNIQNVLASLPYTDLQMGTASSGNFNNNGLRDLIMYQQALKPKVYVPNHLTSGTATREASSLSVYAGYLQQLRNMEQPASGWAGYPRSEWPNIRWLVDPTDYIKPMSFSNGDPAWNNPQKAARVAQFCG